MNTATIGQAIKMLRDINNYSLEFVATEVGIHRETMRLYEIDSEKMKFDVFKKILNLYHISITYFFENVYDNSLIKNEIQQKKEINE